MANTLEVRIPEVVSAAVPFYEEHRLLLHYADYDERVNAGWSAYEQALKSSGVDYEAHVYEGVNHGFHNDTTPPL